MNDEPLANSEIILYQMKLFEAVELNREATIRKFRVVQSEGNRQVAREIEHYETEGI